MGNGGGTGYGNGVMGLGSTREEPGRTKEEPRK